jgi:hypothetical protein
MATEEKRRIMSEGAKKLRLYIGELGGEASEDELETVMKALPTMDVGKLQCLLDELEESNNLKKIEDSLVKLK